MFSDRFSADGVVVAAVVVGFVDPRTSSPTANPIPPPPSWESYPTSPKPRETSPYPYTRENASRRIVPPIATYRAAIR